MSLGEKIGRWLNSPEDGKDALGAKYQEIRVSMKGVLADNPDKMPGVHAVEEGVDITSGK